MPLQPRPNVSADTRTRGEILVIFLAGPGRFLTSRTRLRPGFNRETAPASFLLIE
jgi:hypothetical protein